MEKVNWPRVVFWWLGIIFFVSGIACFFFDMVSRSPHPRAVSPSMSDFATVFFGASSLALIVISLVLAVAAILGWSSIKSDLEKESKASEDAQENVRKAIAENQESVNTSIGSLDSRFFKIQEQTNSIGKEVKNETDSLSDEIKERTKRLEEEIRKQVDLLGKEIKEKADDIIKEVKGRSNLVSGHALAASVLSRYPIIASELRNTGPINNDLERNLIQEAIYVSEQGYRELKEVKSKGQYAALNNIVYYSCVLRLDEKREELLSRGREIKEIGENNRHLQWSVPYFITFCWVILIYGVDTGEVAEALKIGEEILKREEITSFQKYEATDLVASLKEKLKELIGAVPN
ncbi:MAG TPA: hypothetical protein VLQ45_00695 [Thermoanaerobaculia bacterium]|nr:hypothetical protein [Thermoanaerobaculia bacterium]